MNQSDQPSILSLYKGKYLLKGILWLSAMSLAITCTLGIAFWLIFSGIFWSTLRLAPYWRPAYRLTAKLLGVQQTDIQFKPLKIQWLVLPFKCISIGMGFVMIGFGLAMLFQNGFYNQNLIYRIFISH